MSGEFGPSHEGPNLQLEVLQMQAAYEAYYQEFQKQIREIGWAPIVEEWRTEVLLAGDRLIDLLQLLIESPYSSQEQRDHAFDDREEIIARQQLLDRSDEVETMWGRVSQN